MQTVAGPDHLVKSDMHMSIFRSARHSGARHEAFDVECGKEAVSPHILIVIKELNPGSMTCPSGLSQAGRIRGALRGTRRKVRVAVKTDPAGAHQYD